MVFWFFFSKKNKPFFCGQSRESAPDMSRESAPDEKKQKTWLLLRRLLFSSGHAPGQPSKARGTADERG